MFKSIVRGGKQHCYSPTTQGLTHMSPKFLSNSDKEYAESEVRQTSSLASLMRFAESPVKGFLKPISTRWLVLYRPHIRRLHEKRTELEHQFEVSTLRLVLLKKHLYQNYKPLDTVY